MDTYTADKGYDDGENHYHLELRGLYSAIHLKDIRTGKKNDNKAIWLELLTPPPTSTGDERTLQGQRKFGEGKQGHGFGRCRYLSRVHFAVQSFFTAIMLNLKRMFNVLTDVGFKTKAARVV